MRILRFIQRPKNVFERWGEQYATYCDLLSPEGIEKAWSLTMAPLLKEMTPEERSGWWAFLMTVMKAVMATGPGPFSGIPKTPRI